MSVAPVAAAAVALGVIVAGCSGGSTARRTGSGRSRRTNGIGQTSSSSTLAEAVKLLPVHAQPTVSATSPTRTASGQLTIDGIANGTWA